jgi:transposase-like protein
MRGRKARGPEFVRDLQGDAQARERLERILDTVAGRLGVSEAAERLGITPQRLHMLREQALQAALEALQPQPLGRPSKAAGSEQEQIDALQRDNQRLQRELAASKLREEIDLVLPSRPRPRRGEKKRGRDSGT